VGHSRGSHGAWHVEASRPPARDVEGDLSKGLDASIVLIAEHAGLHPQPGSKPICLLPPVQARSRTLASRRASASSGDTAIASAAARHDFTSAALQAASQVTRSTQAATGRAEGLASTVGDGDAAVQERIPMPSGKSQPPFATLRFITSGSVPRPRLLEETHR